MLYRLSYAEVSEWLAEPRIVVDQSTIYRWLERFLPVFVDVARQYGKPVSAGWRVDEMYARIGGRWHHNYRAIDGCGQMRALLARAAAETHSRVTTRVRVHGGEREGRPRARPRRGLIRANLAIAGVARAVHRRMPASARGPPGSRTVVEGADDRRQMPPIPGLAGSRHTRLRWVPRVRSRELARSHAA
ncbi:MAG: IS6 family transposase [Chloroflexi bacterium]|nr:MAG: IS6 family transposase [Chloroflexota bacterium]